jgi:hypothetical protein
MRYGVARAHPAGDEAAALREQVGFLRCQVIRAITDNMSPIKQGNVSSMAKETTTAVAPVTPADPLKSKPVVDQGGSPIEPKSTPRRLPGAPTHHSTQRRTGKKSRGSLDNVKRIDLTNLDDSDDDIVGVRLNLDNTSPTEKSVKSELPVVDDEVLSQFTPKKDSSGDSKRPKKRSRSRSPAGDDVPVHVTRRRR